MPRLDVVVCGMGIMGAAALFSLARRGIRAVGFDRFAPGHERGSSHGETRLIRLSYFEHPAYVPLLHQAYELWHRLESAGRRRLVHRTGIVEIGPPDGRLITGTLSAAREHGLQHERLTAAELMRRFPAFRLPSGFCGVWQPDGRVIEAEPALHTLLALAKANGAQVHHAEAVRAVEPRDSGVCIVTEHGTVEADAAIVTAGPWLKSLLPELPVNLRVTRQAMAWLAPMQPELFAGDLFPAFLLESEFGMHYGVPPIAGSGVKIAKHHHADEIVDPECYETVVSSTDEALIRAPLTAYLPLGNGPLLRAKTCLYTVAPDGDFIIDRLPGAPQVVVASPCSGHGFKFAPVIGEIVADLATRSGTEHAIERFRLDRFA